jgi:hypothetical protein
MQVWPTIETGPIPKQEQPQPLNPAPLRCCGVTAASGGACLSAAAVAVLVVQRRGDQAGGGRQGERGWQYV